MSVQVRIAHLRQNLERLFPGKWFQNWQKSRYLGTGIEAIDKGLTRGIARQRITEWSGPVSSGKITVLREAAKFWCSQGLNVAYVDAEGKLYPADWASVESRGKFWIVRPAEQKNTGNENEAYKQSELSAMIPLERAAIGLGRHDGKDNKLHPDVRYLSDNMVYTLPDSPCEAEAAGSNTSTDAGSGVSGLHTKCSGTDRSLSSRAHQAKASGQSELENKHVSESLDKARNEPIPLISKRNIYFQEAIWAADQFIRSGAFDVVILDFGSTCLGDKNLGLGYCPDQRRLYARFQRSLSKSRAALLIVSDEGKAKRRSPLFFANHGESGCHSRFLFDRGATIKCRNGLKGIAMIASSIKFCAERDGLSQEMEVTFAVSVPNRLLTHSQVPDRRTSER